MPLEVYIKWTLHKPLEVYIYPNIYFFQTIYTPQYIPYTPLNSILCTPYYYHTIYSFQLYTTYTPFNILYTHCSKIYFFLESMIYSFPNNILYIVLQKILYSVFQITYILFSKLCNSAYSNQKYTTVSKKKEKRSVQEIPKKVQEIFGPARTPHQNILSLHGDAFSRPRK